MLLNEKNLCELSAERGGSQFHMHFSDSAKPIYANHKKHSYTKSLIGQFHIIFYKGNLLQSKFHTKLVTLFLPLFPPNTYLTKRILQQTKKQLEHLWVHLLVFWLHGDNRDILTMHFKGWLTLKETYPRMLLKISLY